ncbi:MAG: MotA/TolQ/ExbB proton channel family protein [Lutibacter sp.]
MIDLFYKGGPLFMSILTLELFALIIAAWKAPAWIKEIGLLALITGILGQLIGLYAAFVAIEKMGDISVTLLVGGLKISSITTIYGILIYILSIVIRIIQKPKFW